MGHYTCGLLNLSTHRKLYLPGSVGLEKMVCKLTLLLFPNGKSQEERQGWRKGGSEKINGVT